MLTFITGPPWRDPPGGASKAGQEHPACVSLAGSDQCRVGDDCGTLEMCVPIVWPLTACFPVAP
jgi:hypothetical protein